MTDALALSRWVNGFLVSGTPVLRPALSRDSDRLLRFLENLGVLRRLGIADELSCTVCVDDPHCCRVQRMATGRYRYRCLVNGWIEIAEEDLILLAFDRKALLRALSKAAGSSAASIRLLAGDRLAHLTFIAASAGQSGWTLGYADQLEDENVLASVIDSLATRFPDGPGLIATPSFVPMNLPLPRHYRLIALHELVALRGDEIAIREPEAADRLALRKSVSGLPGRPTRIETVKSLWAALKTTPAWPNAREAQAELILTHWPEDGRKPPKKGTIQNHIRQFERAPTA
jgi:hypothetical protein